MSSSSTSSSSSSSSSTSSSSSSSSSAVRRHSSLSLTYPSSSASSSSLSSSSPSLSPHGFHKKIQCPLDATFLQKILKIKWEENSPKNSEISALLSEPADSSDLKTPDDFAIFNNPSTLENAIVALENLLLRVEGIVRRLQSAVEIFAERQRAPLLSLFGLLEFAGGECSQRLLTLSAKENEGRQTVDKLAIQTEKVKKTVLVGENLSLSANRQSREMSKLDAIRTQRDAALRDLEGTVKERAELTRQCEIIKNIQRELKEPPHLRNYKIIYHLLKTRHFLLSIGNSPDTVKNSIEIVKSMASARKAEREAKKNLQNSKEIQKELRGKANEMMAMNWK